jgi:hypothetical protein
VPTRIWVVLLALAALLLAAPAAGMRAEVADAPAPTCLCDDDALPQGKLPPAGGPPGRISRAPTREGAVPPAPVLARIFRPPRPAA